MGIANVVSLRSLEEKYRVSYDSLKDGGAFIVHTDEGDVIFKRCPDTSFPYLDLDDVTGGDRGAMLLQSMGSGERKNNVIRSPPHQRSNACSDHQGQL